MSDDNAPSVVGDRLRELRRARGVSQAEAAEAIGVSRPTFIAIEQGRRAPQPAEIVRLASLYGRTVHDLVRDTPPVASLAASFRLGGSGKAAVATQVAVRDLEELADDVTELETLTGASMPRNYPPQYDIEGLPTDAAAEQVAEAERRRLGIGDGPVLNLRGLLEGEVGTKVFVFPLPQGVAGLFAIAEPAGACIGVNSLHPVERQRWTLAHEYAHFLTSRWVAEVTETTGGSSRAGERFAEAFAARFLMPAGSVTRRFQAARRSRNGSFTPTDLLQLAAQYQVSAQAFALRLEDLRLVAGGWWADLLSRGFKVNEARRQLGIEVPGTDEHLLPERIRYLAVEAFLNGDLSEGRLARLFRLDRVGARQIVHQLSASQDIGRQGDVQSWIWVAESKTDDAI